WIAPEDLRWKPARVEAVTEGAAALIRTRAGELLGVAGLVSGAERERRGLPSAVFAAEILVGAIPAGGRPFRYRDLPTRPAISADLSLAHPRDLTWEELSAFVVGRSPAHLESFRCLDRHQGPGAHGGRVKTTIRLTFRAPDRTLEQEEVNGEVRRLAAELSALPGVAFGT